MGRARENAAQAKTTRYDTFIRYHRHNPQALPGLTFNEPRRPDLVPTPGGNARRDALRPGSYARDAERLALAFHAERGNEGRNAASGRGFPRCKRSPAFAK